jgi:hypothetical protein
MNARIILVRPVRPGRDDAVPPSQAVTPCGGARCPVFHEFARLYTDDEVLGVDSTLAKFRVIPGECPVGASQLMIICPYPFCDASWKRGLGRPVGPCSSDRC